MKLRNLLKRKVKQQMGRANPSQIPGSIEELLCQDDIRYVARDLFNQLPVLNSVVIIAVDKEGNIKLSSNLNTLETYGLVALALQCQEDQEGEEDAKQA